MNICSLVVEICWWSLKCSEVCHQCVLLSKQENVDVFCKSNEDCSLVRWWSTQGCWSAVKPVIIVKRMKFSLSLSDMTVIEVQWSLSLLFMLKQEYHSWCLLQIRSLSISLIAEVQWSLSSLWVDVQEGDYCDSTFIELMSEGIIEVQWSLLSLIWRKSVKFDIQHIDVCWRKCPIDILKIECPL